MKLKKPNKLPIFNFQTQRDNVVARRILLWPDRNRRHGTGRSDIRKSRDRTASGRHESGRPRRQFFHLSRHRARHRDAADNESPQGAVEFGSGEARLQLRLSPEQRWIAAIFAAQRRPGRRGENLSHGQVEIARSEAAVGREAHDAQAETQAESGDAES